MRTMRVAQRRVGWISTALLAMLLGVPSAAVAPFDHTYAAWDQLVRRHVRWLPDNAQSRVNYGGLAAERSRLTQALGEMSAVSAADFESWGRPQRMAFLINAYNAFTVELILGAWPRVASIKDLGSVLRSPWKQPFFVLLGGKHHLDWIEHEQLRPKYADPRVHAAVNCASIGCPALRPEAFLAATLDAQLDDSMRRFLSDRTRNRVVDGRLEVSAIFKWYRTDFEQGHGGIRRLEDVFARHADVMSDDGATRAALRQGALPVTFLPYDWSLNVVR